MTNPLLSEWTADFALPPFAAIKDDDFAPAFEAALAEARANIKAIAEHPAAPDFTNVIEAMEQAEASLDRVAGVFYNLAGREWNDPKTNTIKVFNTLRAWKVQTDSSAPTANNAPIRSPQADENNDLPF